jgi:hypothetical protein
MGKGMIREINRRHVARSIPDNQSIAIENQTDINRGLDSQSRGTEMGVRSTQDPTCPVGSQTDENARGYTLSYSHDMLIVAAQFNLSAI